MEGEQRQSRAAQQTRRVFARSRRMMMRRRRSVPGMTRLSSDSVRREYGRVRVTVVAAVAVARSTR